MLNQILEQSVQCPYCWETFTLLVDASVAQQEYVEDCEVCCQPIDFIVHIDESEQVRIEARLQHE